MLRERGQVHLFQEVNLTPFLPWGGGVAEYLGMTDKKVDGVEAYEGAAGGWPALGAVARALKGQMAVGREAAALRRVNQPTGFDCPGCAWPDPKHTSSFEFCENGAKAVAWEATGKRAAPALFAAHTVSQLWQWTDHALENEGRLTEPMAYDHATDRYLPIAWDEAFARTCAAIRMIPPCMPPMPRPRSAPAIRPRPAPRWLNITT